MLSKVWTRSHTNGSAAVLAIAAACGAASTRTATPVANNPTPAPVASSVAPSSNVDTWGAVVGAGDRASDNNSLGDRAGDRNVNLLPRPALAPQTPTLPLRSALWPLPRRPQEVPWLPPSPKQQPCQRALNNYWRAWCLYRSGEYQKAIHQMARSLGALDPIYATAARIDFATMVGYHPDPRWLIEHLNVLASSDSEALDAVIASLLMLGRLDDAKLLETAQTAVPNPDQHRLRRCERHGQRLQLAGPLTARSLLNQPRPDPICATIHHLECAAALQAPASAKLTPREFWVLCGFSSWDQPELSAEFRLNADYITWDITEHSADTWYRTAADAAQLLALEPAAEAMFEAALRNYVAVAACSAQVETKTAALMRPYLQYLDLHYRSAPTYLHRLTSITAENCAAIQAELHAAAVASPP
ncbi:MAG: hypothetical protein KBG15_23345 [Kofleriaceae bacterium]|nr:hypothetical protein [Kofleriaceae bacterium]